MVILHLAMELRPSGNILDWQLCLTINFVLNTTRLYIFPQILSLCGEEVPNSQKRNQQLCLQEETREESSTAQNPGNNEELV